MTWFQRWRRERKFNREHRPYLTLRMPDDASGLLGIYCTLHRGWYLRCKEWNGPPKRRTKRRQVSTKAA